MGSSQGMKRSVRCHSTRDQAFRCHAQYLVDVLGYKRVGSREFHKEGSPIKVLSKRSKFGGVLRRGKAGEKGGSRVIPKDHLSGIIYSD